MNKKIIIIICCFIIILIMMFLARKKDNESIVFDDVITENSIKNIPIEERQKYQDFPDYNSDVYVENKDDANTISIE